MEKIKLFINNCLKSEKGKDILVVLIVILVGLGCFETNSKAKNFFASNRGSKYYSLGCAGGKSIILENRIYFATKEEAERAGYQLSSSCQ